ncbi:MAG: VWA domain-containing protein [Polyangiaceae bacterium]|nr:VWA domain-containing protein [Polyangiaceae bacterium]
MSAAFVPFLYELRARKVKVGVQEAVALGKALAVNLHESSLDGFYHVARAICVHRESDLDAFDEAFLAHFKGVTAASLSLIREIDEWLKNPIARKMLSPEELAAMRSFDMESLKRMFEERMKEQAGRHQGGSHWIGTGGASPFGQHGAHPSGLRVGERGGGRTAMGIANAHTYRPYRSDLLLDIRQIEVALRKLRAFQREGQPDELDIDATIDRTAKNAGELEIVTRAPRKSNVRVLLLMDVGGSMEPYAETVSRLFSAAKRASNIRALKTYYFHNCIYGQLYESARLTDPANMSDVLHELLPEWKLVIVGDAAMHPAELLGVGFDYVARQYNPALTGLAQLYKLADSFRRSVWLNPDPPSYWQSGTAAQIARIFPMFHLTLDGLSEAIAHLSKGDAQCRQM